MLELARKQATEQSSTPEHIGLGIMTHLNIKRQEIDKTLANFQSYADQKKLERLKDALKRSLDDIRRSLE